MASAGRSLRPPVLTLPPSVSYHHCYFCISIAGIATDYYHGYLMSTSNIISTIIMTNTTFPSSPHHNYYYHHYHHMPPIKALATRKRLGKGEPVKQDALKVVLFRETSNHLDKLCYIQLSACTQMAPPKVTCYNKCH